jgi:hypothetical protein
MAVRGSGIDRVDHLMRRPVDHCDDGAVLAGDVDHAIWCESERMRRDIGREVDIADMGALFEIDDAEKMSRIGIAAVDTVAEDRHIGEASIRHDEELMHRAGKTIQHHLGRETDGIEKQNFCAHLVDREHSARGVCVGAHVMSSVPMDFITVPKNGPVPVTDAISRCPPFG